MTVGTGNPVSTVILVSGLPDVIIGWPPQVDRLWSMTEATPPPPNAGKKDINFPFTILYRQPGQVRRKAVRPTTATLFKDTCYLAQHCVKKFHIPTKSPLCERYCL